LLYVIIYYKLG